MLIKLFPLLIFIILSTGVQAKEWSTVENKEIIILHSPALKTVAEEMAVIYPGIKSRLEKSLNLKVNFSPIIILEDNHDRFLNMSGHPLVVGFAVPGRYLIVIDYTKMNKNPFSLESITKHELCHLLLHYHIDGDRLPKWLDEGVAQWVSGGLADIVMADHSRLDRAIVTGRYIRIRSLENTFPREEEYLILAYEESKSIVDYIVRQYGPKGLLKVISSLQTGHDINEAVLKSLSITFDELEENWYSALKKNTTWFVLFINHLYEFLFFFAGISLIIAYIRVLIRKRSLKEERDTPEEDY
ncbi:peptidase MA family metallohydrolase [Thermodesulfobacteriota bacterium]